MHTRYIVAAMRILPSDWAYDSHPTVRRRDTLDHRHAAHFSEVWSFRIADVESYTQR